MLGTFIEYFRDWLFNIISCSHFTHVRLLGWQNCLLCIWTPQERIKRTIRVDFWSSALLRFYIISSCFRGASSPAVKSMCESSSWPSELSKHQGTLWHPRSRKKVLDERKNERGPEDRNLMNALPSSRTSDQALFLESYVPYILHQQFWDNTLRIIP